MLLFSLCVEVAVGGEIKDDLEFFENEIRPALIEHCYECHSEEAGKRKGGLWLDRKAGWELGGDSGPSAIRGDVDGSLLIETVRYEDPDLEMPPDGRLPTSVVARFEEWVERGLPDPREEGVESSGGGGVDIETGREFWSLRPRETDFGDRKTIDDFIDARMIEAEIESLGQASPSMRLRRARVDLTGLVPAVEEQLAFEANPTPKRWEETVDRGLGSEAFGERWGRHWLDIVRYADSSGGGRAITFKNAWRFRDYVIRAFDEDKPLDELMRAHLAGDLLPYETLKERSENLIATGFLVMGPINYENQNKEELDFDIIDEQIDTFGRAFLGQTIGCARCHDHKFDPIPTRDYYALAGIFKSTNSVTHANVSAWHREPVPPTETARLEIESNKGHLAKAEKEVAQLKKRLAEMGRGAGGKSKGVKAPSLLGIVIDDVAATKIGEWDESTHSARWVGAGYIHDRNERKGEKSVRFETVLESGGDYELRVSYSAGSNRSTAVPVKVFAPGEKEEVLVNQRLKPEHDGLFTTIGTYHVEAGSNVRVEIWNVVGKNGSVIVDAVQWLPREGDALEKAKEELTKKENSEIIKLEENLAAAEARVKKIKAASPDIPQAMCVVDQPAEVVADTEIRIRGVESNRGVNVPRGFLEVASKGPAEIPTGQSGRLQLAEWLTHPDHPLTARVMANRIWLKLMGEGLVPSPDNFGTTGMEPTHPDLIDFLAGRLIDSGWSTKTVIKEIMMSKVYSRATAEGGETQREQDPENTLYWQAHRRVLDAETMRDAMLTLAGSLDGERGGPSLPAGFKSEFGYEFTTMRRSVYVPVFRNTGYEMFSVFDFANPNFSMGKRSVSNIPTQMLFMTNSEFVHARAEEAASELMQMSKASDRERVVEAFRRTLGRAPSRAEENAAMVFIKSHAGAGESSEAWAGLQRALFGSIDFRFLR